jgi:hypothetical protein
MAKNLCVILRVLCVKVLRESSGCIDDDFALTGPSRTGTRSNIN